MLTLMAMLISVEVHAYAGNPLLTYLRPNFYSFQSFVEHTSLRCKRLNWLLTVYIKSSKLHLSQTLHHAQS